MIVNCSKRRSTRDLPRPSTTRHASSPPSRASPTKQSTSTPAASDQGPHYPTLRANPYPEVTDLFCRLPLSTLFYQLEAVHLGDLLRIWVRPSTKITLTHSDFQGPTRAHWTPQEPWCFTDPASLSPGKLISGTRILTKKRQLSPRLPPTSPSSFALPLLIPKDLSPCLGLGILTQFPFGAHHSTYKGYNAMSGTLIRISPLPLGPTDPCSTAVHMEPFSSLVLKGLT